MTAPEHDAGKHHLYIHVPGKIHVWPEARTSLAAYWAAVSDLRAAHPEEFAGMEAYHRRRLGVEDFNLTPPPPGDGGPIAESFRLSRRRHLPLPRSLLRLIALRQQRRAECS